MRTNKNTDIVFLGLLDTEERLGTLTKFINAGDKEDPNLQKYIEITENLKSELKILGDLEEIILQTKAMKGLDTTEIKITTNITGNTEYVYARVPFYRKDKTAKEIRVLVGKTKDWLSIIGSHNVEDLYQFEPFMSVAYNGLYNAMSNVIFENLDKFKTKVKA